MNNFIDIYCERVGPEFWSEPINAITNLSFILAAFLCYRLASNENNLNWRSLSLIILVFTIGLGSFLFHTFATPWAQLTDVLPILFYQIVFIAVYVEKVLGWGMHKKHAFLALFLASIYGTGQIPDHIQDLFNGSLGYAPALLFLVILSILTIFKSSSLKIRQPWGLAAAALIFLISLTFRSIDEKVCMAFPIGTHFLWHVLNGIVLYLTTRAYILKSK